MKTIRQLFLQNIAQTTPQPMMIEVERAEGIYLYTPDGKPVIDLVSGVSVSNVGHSNPKVIEAIQTQAANYMHTMVYGETVQRVQVEYACRIIDFLSSQLNSVYFVNSGAEAIEGAMKLAKRHTKRTEIISMRNAYHGSTQGALSIQGDEFFKTAFRPLLPDCRLINFNSCEDLELITTRTAAVVCEVIQGEAGIRPADKSWLQALRRRCDAVGALLLLDEIQTGFGRSGSMFAHSQYDVVPDILCLAKALGGGMPLGAFIANKAVMNELTFDPVLGHITTFGGNPVCCAAGLAAINYIADNELCRNAESQGALFESLLAGHPAVQEIRRSGLLLAVELGASDKMYRMVEMMTADGFLTDWFLFCDTAFRISPPLIITEVQTRQTCERLRELLDRI